ncbi:hypothetical protein K438DRAFT_1781910 [Mycena galopus ATCC 62051]|nr:hypothetical protein K438DRAFT_1781910 [Mycena galopus ATCC 62051]
MCMPRVLVYPGERSGSMARACIIMGPHLVEYRRAWEDHVDEAELRDKLFKFILNMEQVLFWLSCLGFWVAWSANYEQLMERLFPYDVQTALLIFPNKHKFFPIHIMESYTQMHAWSDYD